MRVVDPETEAAFAADATTLCDCWLIERRDGVALGFTDCDLDIAFDGVVFEAAAGIAGGAVETALGLSIDAAAIEGALSSDRIAEADFAAGLYDGAQATRWRVDWTDPSRRLLVARGAIGAVERRGGAFRAEIEGLAAALNAPVGRSFSPLCDAALGDARCRADLSAHGRRSEGAVASVEPGGLIVATFDVDFAEGALASGRLDWLGGAEFGATAEIREHRRVGGAHALRVAPVPAAPAPGDALRATVGCDRRFETCAARFDNAENFRGFPHMPGDGWLTAGAARGERR